MLDQTNHYRRLHGVPDMEWDDEVAEVAQGFADKLSAGKAEGHNTYVDICLQPTI